MTFASVLMVLAAGCVLVAGASLMDLRPRWLSKITAFTAEANCNAVTQSMTHDVIMEVVPLNQCLFDGFNYYKKWFEHQPNLLDGYRLVTTTYTDNTCATSIHYSTIERFTSSCDTRQHAAFGFVVLTMASKKGAPLPLPEAALAVQMDIYQDFQCSPSSIIKTVYVPLGGGACFPMGYEFGNADSGIVSARFVSDLEPQHISAEADVRYTFYRYSDQSCTVRVPFDDTAEHVANPYGQCHTYLQGPSTTRQYYKPRWAIWRPE